MGVTTSSGSYGADGSVAGRGRVLVSGASIAGPAAAYWLGHHGFEVTIVERASSLRMAGQNIDVRGPGREVLRRMGLEDAVLAAGTGEVGTRFVDEDDTSLAEFPAGTDDSGGPTAEAEVLRGRLAGILVEAQPRTTYRFGDRITVLEQHEDRVSVTFEDAGPEDFDLVVLAEGIGSATRDLVFPDEVERRDLGMYMAYATVPRTDEDDDWWRWLTVEGGRSVSLRPDDVGTTRALLSFMSDPRGIEDMDAAGQVAVLREEFADVGWHVPRVLAGLDADGELYLERIGQVRAPRWSDGRVVLLGDTAWCASPISGVGTTLALTGAYVLAGELATQADHREAFRRYESIMRPFVDDGQDLPPGAPRVVHPRSRAALTVLRGALRVAGSGPVRSVMSRLAGSTAEHVELPHYPPGPHEARAEPPST